MPGTPTPDPVPSRNRRDRKKKVRVPAPSKTLTLKGAIPELRDNYFLTLEDDPKMESDWAICK